MAGEVTQMVDGRRKPAGRGINDIDGRMSSIRKLGNQIFRSVTQMAYQTHFSKMGDKKEFEPVTRFLNRVTCSSEIEKSKIFLGDILQQNWINVKNFRVSSSSEIENFGWHPPAKFKKSKNWFDANLMDLSPVYKSNGYPPKSLFWIWIRGK